MIKSRKINDIINSDLQIIDLRMQAEDLINAIEHLQDKEYQDQARKITSKINLRIKQILDQHT